MTTMAEKHALLSRLRKDRRGNFAMMAAIAVPIILGAGGFAMDLTNMVLTKAELQDAVDSASLAAASALSFDRKSIAEARAIGLMFFKTQLSGGITNGADLTSATNIEIQETAMAGGGKSFVVNISTGYDLQLNPLTRLFGHTSAKINAAGVAESATESKNALSMFLVLDRSGSMSFRTDEIASKTVACVNWTSDNWGQKNVKAEKPCYVTKIAALKTAVSSLTKEFDRLDPKHELVRTAAVSYNDQLQKETVLDWGTKAALDYVNAIPTKPEGGTDSHGAFAKALALLAPTDGSKETEIPAHAAKNGREPTKYIVFMTDGQNTHYDGRNAKTDGPKSDSDTEASCVAARTAKVIVYTVAFKAPKEGKRLLQACAHTFTSEKDPNDHYFEAEDMTSLIAAFKEIGERASGVISRLSR